MKILAAVLLFALSAARACAAFDVSMFDDRMDKTFLSERGAAFRIAYSAWSVREYAKVFKVAVPKSLEFENLKITVFAANLTERELGYAQTKIPFALSASPFELTIRGRKSAISFRSERAVLTPLNTLVLRGDVRVVAADSVPVGSEAMLELDGRNLYLIVGDRRICFKF